ncbi:hypothetical protein [Polyangium jinanense]|uniref:Uncharacterized protein n=1 Tax=Polyangium jinanense TaxID=2829994 RepID=A0A9X3X9B8_9BACT|nr:hypothetical protein [Polyangium jinanense]MDC3962699.1 hypothetical protein [Polyangium jinanense]MDC3984915.1 hypothetical protein [Polyangium jinanense]
MMFSLSSLVAQASNDAPTTNQTSARSDDSGIIDLKALAATAEAPKPATPVLPHAPIFPFGAPEPAPLPAPEPRAEVVETQSRKGRWAVAAVGAILVSAMAIGAASARPKAEPMTLGGRVSPHFEVALKRAATPPAPPAEVKATTPSTKEATASEKTKVTQRTGPNTNVKSTEPKKTDPVVKEKTKRETLPLEVCDLMCQMRKATQK